MTGTLDITAPATIILVGSLASSLEILPPYGVTLSGSVAGVVSVTLAAGNAAAQLSASGVAGATVSSSGSALGITGNIAQVNAALASLLILDN